MNRRLLLFLLAGTLFVFGAVACVRPAHPAANSLAAQLAQKLQGDLDHIAAGLDGSIGIYAESLDTGQKFAVNADQVFPTGSSIKVMVLVTLLRQDQQGSLRLPDRLTVPHSAMVGGTGVLQDFGDGTSTLSLRDLAALMIVLSDNTATNMLIDRVGMANVNALIRGAGLTHTRLERKMIDQASERVNRENIASPRDMGAFYAELQRGRLLDPAHTALALQLLEYNKQTPLRAGIPPGIRVADKPGNLGGVECTSGLVLLDGAPYVLSVMTAYDRDSHAAQQAITDASQAVFNYFDRLARSNDYGVIVHPSAAPRR